MLSRPNKIIFLTILLLNYNFPLASNLTETPTDEQASPKVSVLPLSDLSSVEDQACSRELKAQTYHNPEEQRRMEKINSWLASWHTKIQNNHK